MKKETNLEHYKNELKNIMQNYYDNPAWAYKHIKKEIDNGIISKGDEYYTDTILEWMALPYKEIILDKAEKEYLSAVIKPFKCDVEYIAKEKSYTAVSHRIKIVVKPTFDGACLERIILPNFETDMYKGMEVGRKYTLEELGL